MKEFRVTYEELKKLCPKPDYLDPRDPNNTFWYAYKLGPHVAKLRIQLNAMGYYLTVTHDLVSPTGEIIGPPGVVRFNVNRVVHINTDGVETATKGADLVIDPA